MGDTILNEQLIGPAAAEIVAGVGSPARLLSGAFSGPLDPVEERALRAVDERLLAIDAFMLNIPVNGTFGFD